MSPTLIAKLFAFLEDPKESAFVLTGKAGTGKTSVIKEMVKFLEEREYLTHCATFTNKAASVLRKKGLEKATTIHRATFQSQPAINENGEKIYTVELVPILGDDGEPLKDPSGNIKYKEELKLKFIHVFTELALARRFKRYRKCKDKIELDGTDFHEKVILIIDEASMIPAYLWEHLLLDTSIKLIIVGDVHQLPAPETTTFELQEKLKKAIASCDYEKSEELQELMKLEQARQVDFGEFLHKLTPDYTLSVNHRTSSLEIKSVFETLCIAPSASYPMPSFSANHAIQRFTAVPLEQRSETLKTADVVIAWRNKEVTELNAQIRKLKHPHLAPEDQFHLPLFDVNEPIITLANYNYQIIVPAAEPALVDDDGADKDEVYHLQKLVEQEPEKKMELQLRSIMKGELCTITKVHTFDAKNEILFVDLTVQASGEEHTLVPLSCVELGYKDPKALNKKLKFARVALAYALTCHRAQGSEYGHVLVYDRVNSPDIIFRRRWRYTAVTRAINRLDVWVL